MPGAVPAGTVTLAVIFTGDVNVGLTVPAGVKAQLAPLMRGLHETVTVWLNDPAAVI
jgi:hypothetical protein